MSPLPEGSANVLRSSAVVIRRSVVAIVLSALAGVLLAVGVPVKAQASSSVSTISTAEYPLGMDFDSSGNLFIASQNNDASGNLGLVMIPEVSGTLFGQAWLRGRKIFLYRHLRLGGLQLIQMTMSSIRFQMAEFMR